MWPASENVRNHLLLFSCSWLDAEIGLQDGGRSFAECLSDACAWRLTRPLTRYLYAQFAVIAHTARLTDTRRFQTLLDAPGNTPTLASAHCLLPVLLCGVERARVGAFLCRPPCSLCKKIAPLRTGTKQAPSRRACKRATSV